MTELLFVLVKITLAGFLGIASGAVLAAVSDKMHNKEVTTKIIIVCIIVMWVLLATAEGWIGWT